MKTVITIVLNLCMAAVSALAQCPAPAVVIGSAAGTTDVILNGVPVAKCYTPTGTIHDVPVQLATGTGQPAWSGHRLTLSGVASPCYAALLDHGCGNILLSGVISGDTVLQWSSTDPDFTLILSTAAQDTVSVLWEQGTGAITNPVPCTITGTNDPVSTPAVWREFSLSSGWGREVSPPLSPGLYWNGSRVIQVR